MQLQPPANDAHLSALRKPDAGTSVTPSLPKGGCHLCPRGRLFASGNCAECNKPVCAKHCEFADGRWLCRQCVRKAKNGKPATRSAAKAKNQVIRKAIQIKRGAAGSGKVTLVNAPKRY
ncbi:MAG: hypothetical protein KGL39_24255 [Patescibacteria group bacterium]|nr:hypothetical protein [Patescibacteria group bacterium]